MKHTKQNSAAARKQAPIGSHQQRIIECLREFRYCTRRQLHKQTGIEIASLCAAIAKLEKLGKVHVPFSMDCETTGRIVAVYTLKGSPNA